MDEGATPGATIHFGGFHRGVIVGRSVAAILLVAMTGAERADPPLTAADLARFLDADVFRRIVDAAQRIDGGDIGRADIGGRRLARGIAPARPGGGLAPGAA